MTDPSSLAGGSRQGGGADRPATPVVIVGQAEEASIALHFDGLAPALRRQIAIRRPEAFAGEAGTLLRASLVIVARRFTGTGPIIALCLKHGIPLWYFTDENVVMLAREDRGWRHYRAGPLRRLLRGFEGAICASPRLLEFFRAARLHPTLFCWQPIRPAQPAMDAATATSGPVTCFAFVGGAFRRRALEAVVVPALIAAAQGRALRLLLRRSGDAAADAALAARCAAAGIAVESFEFDPSFDRFAARMRAGCVQAILHSSGDTANAEYKSLATIAAAHAIGALPLVAREGGFANLGAADGVGVLADEPEAWRQAIAPLIGDAAHVAALRRHFDEACRRHFDGAAAEAFLAGLIARHAPGDSVVAARLDRFRRQGIPGGPLRRFRWRLRGL